MIYLDNSSTTKPLPRVAASCAKALGEDFGNPSSLHRLGLAAEKALKGAKSSISATFGLSAGDFTGGELSMLKSLVLTSGGTESDNTALFGMAEAGKRYGKHLVTTAVEHPAVLEAMKELEKRGFRVTYLPVARDGSVRAADLEEALTDDTVGVSVMAVNNELGTVYPVAEFARLVHKKAPHALFHTDAVQAYGKVSLGGGAAAGGAYSLGLAGTEIDLVSVSAHKVHGPKGVGALYVREGVRIPPFVFGGGQESGFRSGTENTVGLAGFGAAAEELFEHGAERIRRMAEVRTYLRDGILAEIPDVSVNGPFDGGAPSVLNVSFPGCRGEVLLHTLEQKEIYVSTGSACSSNSKNKGSHVLRACGLSPEAIEGALRFSFSGENTVQEMDIVIGELKTAVALMRKLTHR
ncbi:MAG: cysteine desulfurase [Firmicutes bacterium]|nr:cysteine desulfurase [Bacillota bacterium]